MTFVRTLVLSVLTILLGTAAVLALGSPDTPEGEVLSFSVYPAPSTPSNDVDDVDDVDGLDFPIVAAGAVITTLEEETRLIEEAAERAATTTTSTTTTIPAPTTTAGSTGTTRPAPTTTSPPPTSPPSTTQSGFVAAAESDFASRMNAYRSNQGLPALARDGSLDSYARSWAKKLAEQGSLSHSNIGSLIPPWSSVGENVGRGGSVGAIFDALIASSGHRSNILGDYTHFGIGVFRDQSGTLWTAHVFGR
jgi:uncharacterized protein YkwD